MGEGGVPRHVIEFSRSHNFLLLYILQVDRETTKDQVNGRNGDPHLSSPKTTFDHMQQVAKNNELISDKLTTLETIVQQLKSDYVPFSRFSEVEHRRGTAVTKEVYSLHCSSQPYIDLYFRQRLTYHQPLKDFRRLCRRKTAHQHGRRLQHDK